MLPSQQGLVLGSRPLTVHPCCVVLPLGGVHRANKGEGGCMA